VPRPALVLVGTAASAAVVDLGHKATAAPAYLHGRSAGYVALVVGLTLAWAAAIVLTRSPAMALGGGIAAGGAIGNVFSLVFWAGVPNPIEVAPIAFNLADVFVLVGFLLVAAKTIALADGDRERVGEPLRLRSRRQGPFTEPGSVKTHAAVPLKKARRSVRALLYGTRFC
jgi:hypothetical protein